MSFPQELIDKIIDGVWDADDSPSHTTTKAASLISKSWVNRSQRHLFRDVEFSVIGSHFVRWCDVMSPDPNGISRHIRSLTIRSRSRDGWWIDEKTLECGLPFFDSFRNVQVLRIDYWDIERFPPELLTGCFTPLARSVRVLQWDTHPRISRKSWTHVIGLFPLIDCLLLHPEDFPTGLLFNTPAGVTRKKLLSGNYSARCLEWGGGSLQFQEIYIRCGFGTPPQTFIPIVNGFADRLEVLSIVGRGQTFFCIARLGDSELSPPASIDPSDARILTSFLSSCRALHELSIDWIPVVITWGLYLIDAIPGGCIQSLRVLPDRSLWIGMWDGSVSGVEPSRLMPPYEKLAQAILRLGMRNSGRKVSVWFVIPRTPYIIRDPVMECVVALWTAVEGVVSFGFHMTEAEAQNVDKRHPVTNLA